MSDEGGLRWLVLDDAELGRIAYGLSLPNGIILTVPLAGYRTITCYPAFHAIAAAYGADSGVQILWLDHNVDEQLRARRHIGPELFDLLTAAADAYRLVVVEEVPA